MRNTILLDGVWDFEFLENTGLEDIMEHAGTAPGCAVSVPGCHEALKKYFARKGSGIYSRKVRCGGFVRLRIEALGLRGRVFWDGRLIGCCEHPFSREEFFFESGSDAFHTIGIAVENIAHPRESGKMFYEDYDFYGYAGIYDSVTITELSGFWIDSFQVIPFDLEGNVKIKIFAGGEIPDEYSASIAFDGKECVVKKLSGETAEFTAKVPYPKIWSTETPFMHTAELSISAGDVSDRLETSFGIRTIEAKDAKIYLNGIPVRLVGYNRHDSHPEFGYAVPQFLMCSDISLIKEQGCNFIRGCHYPQREKFLDLCDRMGVLVWDEVLGWNNQPPQCKNQGFRDLEIEQARTMVRTSANHPSVIIWGFLNEVWMPETAGDSPRPLVEALAKTIREEDSSRLITFAFAIGWIGNDDCLDLVDVLSFNTYPGWYGWWENPRPLDTVVPKLKELAELASSERLKSKPLIISEIGAAALYGFHDDFRWGEEYQEELVAAALEETFANPRYSGIVFWHFCDAKTTITTRSILSRTRGFNNKGLLDEYRRPKQAWRRVKEILAAKKFNGRL